MFLNHQIWCTPYDAAERFPGGDFPNQLVGIDGLPKWTKNAYRALWISHKTK